MDVEDYWSIPVVPGPPAAHRRWIAAENDSGPAAGGVHTAVIRAPGISVGIGLAVAGVASVSGAPVSAQAGGGTQSRTPRRAAMRLPATDTLRSGRTFLGAILLALAGAAMATVGIIRFRRTPQPAPGLFSPSEILEIYRLSLTSAVCLSWAFLTSLSDLLAPIFLPATADTWIWTNFIAWACLVVALYAGSPLGIPAQIDAAKLEKLFAGISRLENLVSGAPGTTADATGRNGSI